MVKRSGAGGRRGGSKERASKAGRRGAKTGAKDRSPRRAGRPERGGRAGRAGLDGRGARDGRAGGQAGGRAGRRPNGGAREGRVVALLETRSAGQLLIVEDDARLRWQVECLGEAVGEGARIRFEPLSDGSSPRGVLVRVLDDVRSAWVCTLRARGSALELVPFGAVETPPLVLAPRQTKSAQAGDRVVVVRDDETAKNRGKKARPRGRAPSTRALPVRIVEVLGPAGDPDADHRALVWKYRLPADFSRRARLEVEAIAGGLAPAVLEGRVDLRALPFITIDPATARDHDDALYAEPRPRRALELVETHAGYSDRLWVAIADVSHYVEAGSFVDAEARRRGNSFYFPDRAIPMLPERLSSDLCSLRPGVDRLVLAVELRLSATGEILDALFHEAVIRSHAKLSYEEAAARLEEPSGDETTPSDAPWLASLLHLGALAKRLGAHRRAAGAIELELPEVEISVDETGRPVDAALRLRNPAHALVEEAMLAANRAVAKALERARRDTLHRVHPSPDPRRLETLALLLERFGVDAGEDLEEPGAIAGFLERVRGWPAQERIHLATLRAMSQARYEASSRGHFALQFPHYLHFTSPIRRYADLVVHRALKALLRGEPASASPRASASGAPEAEADGARAAELERLALWLSGRERVAIDAEREAAALACCAMLAGREGELFDAEVTGVAEPGLFVRLARPAASGLVPMRLLDSRWRLDLEEESLEDGAGGRRIEVGAKLRVRLVSVDDDRGRIAFALAGTGERRPRDHASARDSDSASHSR